MNRMRDTLSALHDLEEAGIERRQAEAIVSAIGNADEQLVTKSDLDSAVATLNARIEHSIEHLASKAFVLQVGLGIMLANVTLTVGLIKLIGL